MVKDMEYFKPYYTQLVTLDNRVEIENILSEIQNI